MQLKDDFTQVWNYRTGQIETVSTDALLNLANAIIIRACDDYNSKDYEYRLISLEKFFRSEYANILMRGCCNPDKLINYLRGD